MILELVPKRQEKAVALHLGGKGPHIEKLGKKKIEIAE